MDTIAHAARPAPTAVPQAAQTLPALFAWRVAATPDDEAYRQFDTRRKAWTSTTWAEAGEQVTRWTQALASTLTALNVPRGARIAILLPNGLDAMCIDQATMALACVPVPLHAIDNPQSIAYILGDSEASVLVAFSESQWQAIASVSLPLPALKLVVLAQAGTDSRGSPASDDATPKVMALREWLPPTGGVALPRASTQAPPEADDLAALVYTSGTTGKPKGVMLTHANIVSNVMATLTRVAPRPDDILLSFLPMSHTFERTAGYYLPMVAGCAVAYARSVALLAEDFKTVRPTILVSVPRIYERVHSKLQEALAASPMKARLFRWTETVGWRRFCRQQGLPVEGGGLKLADDLAWPLLDRLVAQKMRAQFGGRLRVAVSGGAPLSQPVAHCFLGLGLPIVQGYGMTETSPILTGNTPEDNDPATVGRAFPGVELRIGDNHELLVRGPGVMRGYWKREDDTARAFTEGWLRTGDQADIVNGRVRILGRLKEIIVTSTGEKIAPADLEMAISADPLFEQVYVFGDNRPAIGCIVVLNAAEWARLAASLALDPSAPDSLNARKAQAVALQRIKDLTGSFPYYAQPRAVRLSLEPWTPENTLMTPTLKIKRNQLAQHFAAQINAMYEREPGQRAA